MRGSIQSIVIMSCMVLALGAAAPVAESKPPAAAAAAKSGGSAGYSGGSGGDPLRFRQLTSAAIRERLGADEEQWKLLWPKVEKVMEAQRNARTGAGMSFSSGPVIKGTPPPGAGGPPRGAQMAGGSSGGGAMDADTPAGRAMQQIRAALEQPAGAASAASDAELTEKLAAMRAARDAARADVVAAQRELHDACSPRQEAVLVTLGLLE